MQLRAEKSLASGGLPLLIRGDKLLELAKRQATEARPKSRDKRNPQEGKAWGFLLTELGSLGGLEFLGVI